METFKYSSGKAVEKNKRRIIYGNIAISVNNAIYTTNNSKYSD